VVFLLMLGCNPADHQPSNVRASKVSRASEDAAPEPTVSSSTADGNLRSVVCDDESESPLSVACLVGRPVGEVFKDCEASTFMGCPTVNGPGFAILGCRHPDGLPETYDATIVRWSKGPLNEVPSSVTNPDQRAVGVERRMALDEGTDLSAALHDALGQAEAAGCRTRVNIEGERLSKGEARCEDVELEITAATYGGPHLGVRAASSEVHDCFWAGKHGGAGTRPDL